MRVDNALCVVAFSALISELRALKFGSPASPVIMQIRTTALCTKRRDERTLELEEYTLASCDKCTGLPHTRKRKGHFLLIATRNAVGDNVYLVIQCKKVQCALENTDVTLR